MQNPRRFNNVPVSLNDIIRGLKTMLAHNKNNNNHNLGSIFNVPGTFVSAFHIYLVDP